MENNNRSSFSSNFGFILTSIGSAIGLGNLWGFPYKMGANGGFPFLLIYLFFVITCGVIIIGIEMTIGRKTRKSPAYALMAIGKKYAFIGYFGVISATVIMGFYGMLAGYALRYLVGFALQIVGIPSFQGLTGGDFFGAYTSNWVMVLTYTVVVILLNMLVIGGPIEKGIERFNKIGMPALFILLLIVIIYNFTLPGSTQGLTYMFTTKGMEMAGTEFDFFKATRTAAGQMLFSCSLGMGIMITYGSYMDNTSNISKNAWIIPAFDTLAALLAGLAIFPAVFAQGQSPAGGVGLLYITMHTTFTSMGYIGNIIGFLFYLLVIFAAFSSIISLMEVTTSHLIDRAESKGKTITRKQGAAVTGIVVILLTIPVCIDQLGGKGWAIYQWLGEGSKDLLDLYDFFTEGVMLPLCALLMTIIIGYVVKFKWMSDEVEIAGDKFFSKKFFEICIKYITPILMAFVLVSLALSYLGL